MNCKFLKKHIVDTVKEWQIKIGYHPGPMKLYYPAASLTELLGLPEDAGKEQLTETLQNFAKEEETSLFRKGRPLESDDPVGGLCLDP